jgi:demethylmenaquinone methyltransferase/2-methoxy-6-polyprenyl-1,4-benzoquinol methylase
MTVKPYPEADTKKEQIRTMFDRIAFRYDFLNRVLSFGVDRGWRRRTVRAVAADRPAVILDVATGTGDLAIGLARALTGARITGVDLSSALLAVARRKVVRKRIPNITLSEGDAENLPFDAEAFDAVTAGFGVRNFGNIPAGLSEMHRVLKPGGKVCILEFSMPPGRIFGRLYVFYFRRLLPFIGGIVSGENRAYRYLQQSVEDFPYGDRFAALMAQAGFSAVTQTPLTHGLAIIYRGEKRKIDGND